MTLIAVASGENVFFELCLTRRSSKSYLLLLPTGFGKHRSKASLGSFLNKHQV